MFLFKHHQSSIAQNNTSNINNDGIEGLFSHNGTLNNSRIYVRYGLKTGIQCIVYIYHNIIASGIKFSNLRGARISLLLRHLPLGLLAWIAGSSAIN